MTRSTAGTSSSAHGGRSSDAAVRPASTARPSTWSVSRAWIGSLESELREGTYRPLAVQRVAIPKAQGGERMLGVPAVRDRVVQAAAKLVIEPVFEADFLDCSHGFRPRRSERARRCGRTSSASAATSWSTPTSGFFDNLDRGLLRRALRRRLCDRRVLALIDSWLCAGVLAEGELLHPEAGTPQGGVISPLLANLYLHALDRAWQECNWRLGKLTRYADDLVIVCWKQGQARRALAALARLMAGLGLELSAEKTRIVDLEVEGEGIDLLGYQFRRIPSRRDPTRRYTACWPSREAMDAGRFPPTPPVCYPASWHLPGRTLTGWRAQALAQVTSCRDHLLDSRCPRCGHTVALTALDDGACAEHLLDGLAQGLAAIDHHEHAA